MRSSYFLRCLALFCLAFVLLGCQPNANKTLENFPDSPTEEFSGKNAFGDGYIAHVPIDDVKEASQEEIVKILVTQWLEHYKSESTDADATIKDYKLDGIDLLERKKDSDPAILASVGFSIIPAQTPNEWASFPGNISFDDSWWHLVMLCGIHQRGEEYYWLRLIPIG